LYVQVVIDQRIFKHRGARRHTEGEKELLKLCAGVIWW